jgi:hypothetical protein
MTVMRKYLILAAVLLASAAVMRAEEPPADSVMAVTDTLALQDSVAERYMSYDSLMAYLGDAVIMSDSLEKAMTEQVEKNKARKTQVYRVRIYFDNSKDARTISQQIVDTFSVYHPGVPVFRSYDNPYFKVTVGEFRTKSDAMRFLEAIRKEYPTVFLVRESFSTI